MFTIKSFQFSVCLKIILIKYRGEVYKIGVARLCNSSGPYSCLLSLLSFWSLRLDGIATLRLKDRLLLTGFRSSL